MNEYAFDNMFILGGAFGCTVVVLLVVILCVLVMLIIRSKRQSYGTPASAGVCQIETITRKQ